ncbi:hypothetical protein DFH11DRAFT_1558037 [Phellopilus nigrolimitatus]|nr:hypothetical protein DFH11DRAFT_1558037 [Phellopilus nigrolimitatus]
MMADVQVKRKVAVSARVNYAAREHPSRSSSPTKLVRSPSPSKRAPTPTRRVSTQTTSTTTAPPRLRAKVNSSANLPTGRKPAGSLTPGYGSGTSTPRAPSPVKQLDSIHGRLSPKPSPDTLSRMRSRITVNATAVSAPNSPRVDQPAQPTLPAAISDSALMKPITPRVRHASISSMSQISSASSARAGNKLSPTPSVASCSQDSDSQSNPSILRIKAKVTGLAKNKPPAAPTPTSPAPLPLQIPSVASPPSMASPNQLRQRLGRTSSVSSLSSKEVQFYPITTAAPAANVHRFATVRTSSGSYRPPQSFPSPLHSEQKPLHAHVDPALVPLPPLSPPSSTVSFSSRSSASRSSVSSANQGTAPTFSLNVNGPNDEPVDSGPTNGQNTRINKRRPSSIVIHDVAHTGEAHADLSSEENSDEADEERTIRAEAKSNRKIADLEITNKSLLAINIQLEANKHKQAKEIRELRRKLRESRLVLPPHAYHELKSSNGVEDFRNDDEEEDEEENSEANASAEAIQIGKDDELFNRVRGMIDSLLESGRQAIESKVEDFAPPRGAAKVLHEEEARSWRNGRRWSESGMRTPADDDGAGDDTFDETFVTADSGDEALDSRSRRQSAVKKIENGLRIKGEVQGTSKDLTSV